MAGLGFEISPGETSQAWATNGPITFGDISSGSGGTKKQQAIQSALTIGAIFIVGLLLLKAGKRGILR